MAEYSWPIAGGSLNPRSSAKKSSRLEKNNSQVYYAENDNSTTMCVVKFLKLPPKFVDERLGGRDMQARNPSLLNGKQTADKSSVHCVILEQQPVATRS
jgi:hypothetical protein